MYRFISAWMLYSSGLLEPEDGCRMLVVIGQLTQFNILEDLNFCWHCYENPESHNEFF